MSSKWKYSSLGQRDRLKLIRNGNNEVYNAEKKLNQSLKKARQDLGLDTSDIDSWDSLIDTAHFASGNYLRKNIDRSGFPKFMNSRESKATNELNEYMRQLESETENEVNEAVNKAAADNEYLEEWLAGNGYSMKGKTSRDSHDDVEDELAEAISEIIGNYKEKSEKARSKYMAQLRAAMK